jgi:hypothetical protein
MVFHLFERTFGTYGDLRTWYKDNDYEALVQKGFSEEEAKNLAWFNQKQNKGKYWGIVAGLWICYCAQPTFRKLATSFPRFKYQPYWINISRIGIVYASYFIGNYLGTATHRMGANDQWSTLWKNYSYLFTREKLIHGYEPLNRKFTEEEVSEFYVNEIRRTKPRNWIYNQYVHGDKAAWEESVRYYGNSRITSHPDVSRKIDAFNQEKIDVGEKIQREPFDINSAVDRTEKKQGIEKFPMFTGWRPLN